MPRPRRCRTYDDAGRLATAKASRVGPAAISQGYGQSYSSRDPAWTTAGASMENLERVSDVSGITDYTYEGDRATQLSDPSGVVKATLSYDHAGRATSRVAGAVVEGFTHDALDRLVKVTRSGQVDELLEYAPTGEPIFRKLGTRGTWYVGSVATVTADVPASCTDTTTCVAVAGTVKVAAHVQVAGGRVASVKAAAGTGLDPVSEALYYHRDMQGSVVATTYRTGALGARYRYTPYGQLDRAENVSPSSDSELGYTGGLRLGYTAGVPQQGNLVLLGARVYHAVLKRWLVPDTVDGRRYTYTGGDPVNFVDPSGRMSFPNKGMAELYYRLFYDELGTGLNWNLLTGSSEFEGRVANQTYLIELQAYADRKNSEPPIYLDGLDWRPFGFHNGRLVASLGSTVASLMQSFDNPIGTVTMEEQIVNTGHALGDPPRLPSWEDRLWEMEMSMYRYRPAFPTMEVLGIMAYSGYSSQYRGRLLVKSISNIRSNAKYAWANRRSPAEAWVGVSGVGVSILEMAGIKTAFVAGWATGRGIDDFIGRQAQWDEHGSPWGVCP